MNARADFTTIGSLSAVSVDSNQGLRYITVSVLSSKFMEPIRSSSVFVCSEEKLNGVMVGNWSFSRDLLAIGGDIERSG